MAEGLSKSKFGAVSSSLKFHAGLGSTTFCIQPPVLTASSLHPGPRLLLQGLDLLKPFLKFTLLPSATVHLYNMVLIITGKPSCSTIAGLITS